MQIHVFSIGCPEVERMLMFRDRLRSHPDDRDVYERTKRDLAVRRWAYVQDYADANRRWSRRSSGEPGGRPR